MEKSFTLNLDGSEYNIEVHGNTFIVNGHPFVLGFKDDGSVTVDGIAYNVTLDGDKAIVEDIVHHFQVSGLDAGPASATPAPPPPPSTLRAEPQDEAATGAGAVQAIMPGTIVRVLANEGDEVNAGDVVLVLEAMKMENELHAPVSGVVKTIHVQPGQAVEMNAVLAEIKGSD